MPSNITLTDKLSFALYALHSAARDFEYSEVTLAYLALVLFFVDEHTGCKIVSSAN